MVFWTSQVDLKKNKRVPLQEKKRNAKYTNQNILR